MVICKTCGTTDQSLFYASIKTYCKEHWKEKVNLNRIANIEHYRQFDKLRASLPHRVAARNSYAQTEKGKLSRNKARKNYVDNHPDCVAKFKAIYAKSEKRKASLAKYYGKQATKISMATYQKQYRKLNPERRAAHIALGNAIRDGKIEKFPCFICGAKAEAHHPDYSRPLDVMWLCPSHHKQAHALAKQQTL